MVAEESYFPTDSNVKKNQILKQKKLHIYYLKIKKIMFMVLELFFVNALTPDLYLQC